MSVIKPRDFGAAGDSKADDTSALRATFAAATAAAARQPTSTKTVIDLGGGQYRVSGELTLDTSTGVSIIGDGNTGTPPGYGNGGYAGRQTGSSLVWDGANGGLMLKLKKSNSGVIKGVNFLGLVGAGLHVFDQWHLEENSVGHVVNQSKPC